MARDGGMIEQGRGLRLRNVAKTFPGVRALRGIDLDVRAGSVHALLGHNGCGKSTLVKILAGFHTPDEGWKATLDGQPLELGSAKGAEHAGIRFVHQELGLIAELGPADNIGLALGYERDRAGGISWRRQARRTAELLDRFGVDIDPDRPIGEATPVARAAIAIVRAIAGRAEDGMPGLLVLDEPTASLPGREVEQLFRLIHDVRDAGTAVLLISHRLDEVMEIADHATVMRSGEVIWNGAIADASIRSFATLIAGSEVEAVEAAHRPAPVDALEGRPVVLGLESVSGRYLRGIDLDLHRGEVLGIAGLLGSGREELPYVVAGASTDSVTGRFRIAGETLPAMDLRTARAFGIALVPADRAREGVIGPFRVRENVSLASLGPLTRRLRLSRGCERTFAGRWLEELDAAPDVAERPITTLSGGNQQKAVLARWLSTGPTILAVSEPTAGIDIGARTTIYERLRARADDGLAVLMSSSDAEDLVASCDRVIVLRDG
ncbi:MAG: sugar ABC transporter ATP-binding protein, partial [Solirubrobacteraceae bacterium]